MLSLLQAGPFDSAEPLDFFPSQGSFLDWSVVAGIFISGLLFLWILGQVRETRRLHWVKRLAAAIRRQDTDKLDELRREAGREPGLVLLSELVIDLGEMMKIHAHRDRLAREDLGNWRERYLRSPIAAFVLENDKRISAANTELCWLLGRGDDEVIGLRLSDLTSAQPLDDRYAWAEIIASTGEGTRSRLVHFVTGDNTTVPTLMMSRPVFDRTGVIVREYCVLVGLSGLPQQEHGTLENSGQSLEAMARLAGCVAHDFNDVLTSILGHGTFLQGRLEEGDPAREDAEEIMEAARGARQLTDQLLAFSRREVLTEGDLAKGLKHPGPAPAVPIDDPLICVVEDDDSVRSLLVSVLQNEGFRVIVAGDGEAALELCQASKRDVDLLLADVSLPGVNGPELYDRLRDRFENLRVLFTSGFVDEEVFHAELPGFAFIQKPFTPHELLLSVRAMFKGSTEDVERKLVLVVDDEASTRRLLESLLNSLDCDCIFAGDGEEALEKLVETTVDAVITDMVMPKMDGIQTCTAIQERFPDVKCIAMSGKSAGSSNLAAAEKLGAVATLSKPFSKDELNLALQTAFRADDSPEESTPKAA